MVWRSLRPSRTCTRRSRGTVASSATTPRSSGRAQAHEIFVEAEPEQVPEVVANLVDLYEARSKPDKAAEWRAKLPEAE